jgi:hypothetical protein
MVDILVGTPASVVPFFDQTAPYRYALQVAKHAHACSFRFS